MQPNTTTRREQLANTHTTEVAVAVRPNAPIQQQGEVYIGFHYTNIVPPDGWVWLDGNAWDLEAYLMAQHSLRTRHLTVQ